MTDHILAAFHPKALKSSLPAGLLTYPGDRGLPRQKIAQWQMIDPP